MDSIKAEMRLREACARAKDSLPDPSCASDVRLILEGKHLTFRYILLTALLGKSTDPSVNARSLQAGAGVSGAYDARSLCHKVIVPLEDELFAGALGGSNEPFLNKPARFPMIDPGNAVRKGEDQTALDRLYTIACLLEEKPEEAFDALIIACAALHAIGDRRKVAFPQRVDSAGVLRLLQRLLSESSGGEIPVLLAGTVLRLLYSQMTGECAVAISPVNQAGSSSREAGDIELWAGGRLEGSIEVKDKKVGMTDVQHALRKAREGGAERFIFLQGGQAPRLLRSELRDLQQEAMALGIEFTVWKLSSLVSFAATLPGLDWDDALTTIQGILREGRMSDDTIQVVKMAINESLKR